MSFQPFAPSSGTAPSSRKSMEEVWKEINLASLQDHTNYSARRIHTHHSSSPGTVLQDFLARPFNKDQSSLVPSAEPSSNRGPDFFKSLETPYPATVLSLNSGAHLDYLKSSTRTTVNPRLLGLVERSTPSFDSSLDSPVQGLDGLPFSFSCKKRSSENDDNSGDRRHKRMIKNRESAARSRARKQAYTNELELEVAHLIEENAKLRRQQEKILAVTGQLPKKHTLYRTLTAPF
ncbi:hypothetical protein K2173_027711 [Erythroxylum novogranatense]|uniref:BZIP domain-containing protein n=1 Tax=Erythroxylum novogranatense TaxID=1862640 RepID=A0AAV8U2N5_9ROSI|nr:hypothetical protein K2173_027711 [Erythroxylum novogranatense]